MTRKAVVIIPARLNSSRLPNKVLLDLGGKPVIQRVYEQCIKADLIDRVIIAVDSNLVYDRCKTFTSNIVMTDTSHCSGSDRIAAVAQQISCDFVINVQGDEPFISKDLINQLVLRLQLSNLEVVSAYSRLSSVDEFENPNVVKVLLDSNHNALYFSRAPIPFVRSKKNKLSDKDINHLNFYKHYGIYGYSKDFLIKFAAMPTSFLENIEKLEQLRMLENGHKIAMIQSEEKSIGIDTYEDYEEASRCFL